MLLQRKNISKGGININTHIMYHINTHIMYHINTHII